jgi:competence protein ComEC
MRTGVLLLLSALCLTAADKLDIYFIDVEAGNATLIVSPSGESMLIDGGTPNMVKRDLAAIQAAGLKQIDYLLVTHFHQDHFGAVPGLAKEAPVIHFVDHGPAVEAHKDEAWKNSRVLRFNDDLYDSYLKVREGGKHIVAAPGDHIPVKGLNVLVLTANGKHIGKPAPGGGAASRWCDSTPLRAEADNEDAQSVGTLISFGKFRFLFLGDLTWNNGIRLVCPKNLVGPVDLFLTTHHAMQVDKENGGEVISSYSACSQAEVWDLAPRVAILNYGPGWHQSPFFHWFGGPKGWDTVRQSPGLEDAWQMHYQPQGGTEHNVSDPQFIANLATEKCPANWLRLTASKDGAFSITNTRTGFVKQYQARK